MLMNRQQSWQLLLIIAIIEVDWVVTQQKRFHVGSRPNLQSKMRSDIEITPKYQGN